jgi:nitroreductase
MKGQVKNPRVPEVEVDAMFLDRWSPRAFSSEPVGEQELAALFEAARWAPSCYNEQPWLFLYGRGGDDLERFRSLLVEGNRTWAESAPVLGVVFAKRHFDRNGKPNRHFAFDTGAAWMSLALQARKLGLYTHAMGGFDEDRSYEVLGVPKQKYEAMVAIAIGRRADAARLPDQLARMENPSDRKPLTEIAVEGRFPDSR